MNEQKPKFFSREHKKYLNKLEKKIEKYREEGRQITVQMLEEYNNLVLRENLDYAIAHPEVNPDNSSKIIDPNSVNLEELLKQNSSRR